MGVLPTVLILGFGMASYVVGCGAVVRGQYRPNVFSRVVWLVLAALSFAGVLGSGGGSAAVLLAAIFLAGNAAMCGLSFVKGAGGIGPLEVGCLVILVVSALVWVVFDAPLVSLAVSLLAHFVGGAPTYRSVWRDPASESAGFWVLFFAASVFSFAAALGQAPVSLVFPGYFVLFDGGMTVLSLRGRRRRSAQ